MHTPFFITGFPRSRTAWMANWLTTDETLCFHEPGESVEELISQYPQFRIGVSSCMLMKDFFAVCRQYPQSPWVFIERQPEQCRESMLRFAGDMMTGQQYDDLIQTHFSVAQIIKDHPRTLTVAFEDLDKRLPDVWHHVFPELTFNAIRAHLLIELKVEQRLQPALNRITNGREILWQHSQ